MENGNIDLVNGIMDSKGLENGFLRLLLVEKKGEKRLSNGNEVLSKRLSRQKKTSIMDPIKGLMMRLRERFLAACCGGR
jgi:hypothetical protein